MVCAKIDLKSIYFCIRSKSKSENNFWDQM